ncbi:MAG: BrnT family toxin [Firmicutes bacterium]|jgi:hypothetical protein|nr:BrnT family toxin [Bacillota bacterium]MCL5065045.1 BrnT family toxin [Bacillota bacterium]
MRFEWDERKREANILKHALDFIDAAELFREPYVAIPDQRSDYHEVRWIAYGLIQGRVCVCVYTERFGVVRIISLRKGNQREQIFYQAHCPL